MQIDRRDVLKAMAASGLAALPFPAGANGTDERLWALTWDAALATLADNVAVAPGFDAPVLFEGPIFQGIWQECGPHESLGYAELADYVKPVAGTPSPLEVARNSHRIFFRNQRADGQLPAYLNKRSGINFGQIQMVVPIAATALETARKLRDEAFLLEAYTACSRWDAWLSTYRNTRGTGLIEAFCTFDTGQDNSPRWAGVSDECPGHDAKRFTPGQSVPRLCPDLSATVFGARTALSAMASALGKASEARKWKRSAEQIRRAIIERLWCDEDASFYDVGPDGSFIRVRSVATMRVLGEHVLRMDVPKERRMFEALWERQLHNPSAYWARYPFPSIALDDPKFVRPIPFNSWGGASQALTAYRALRWMDHYGKSQALEIVMERWCEAIFRSGFCQQLDPNTGIATKSPIDRYSPAALIFLHFAKRLGKAPAPAWRSGA
jgi:hypothetical protein